ncbi:hypothetical protein ACWGDX_24010 [Streptomyces sp. NPDC055025]
MTHTAAPDAVTLGKEIADRVLAALPGLLTRMSPAEFAKLTADRLVEYGLASPPATCTKYDWCKETGAHDMCWSTAIELPGGDAFGTHSLPAHLMAVDGEAPEVGFLDLGLTPDQAREHARQVIRHMGEVLLLADLAEGVGPLEPDAESYGVRAGEAGGRILNAELYTTDDENPADRVTRISVWSYCGDDDLNVEQTDQLIEDLEDFLPQLRALRNRVAELNAARGRA